MQLVVAGKLYGGAFRYVIAVVLWSSVRSLKRVLGHSLRKHYEEDNTIDQPW